ncbi:Spy/CpxP family protein refolding chaperone [Vibrio hyugaensis]|uniref:Spy/CpxP family protein refolding chaperone n=1 Tax=Vibrio hyugaensis TaxID=1534743 RepID=UPI000CE48ADA|nr:Spy/CpxP family protein refolding chaperone [Vibrio hyugaensis]
MKRYLLSTILLLSSANVFAESAPTQPVAPKPFGLESITAEQQAKIEEIQLNLSSTLTQEQSPQDIQESAKQFEKLVKAPSFDEAKAKVLLERANKKQVDIQIAKLKAQNDIYNVLTDDQKSTLEKRQQEQIKKFEAMKQQAQ